MSGTAPKLSFSDFGLEDPEKSDQLVPLDVADVDSDGADDLDLEMADAGEMMSDGEVSAREQIDLSREMKAAAVSSDWMNVDVLRALAEAAPERASATRYARAAISARRFTGMKADVPIGSGDAKQAEVGRDFMDRRVE